MTEAEALALLAGNGRLVKRPFVLGDGFGLVGFDPDAWAAALKRF
jgi:arsenate reductase